MLNLECRILHRRGCVSIQAKRIHLQVSPPLDERNLVHALGTIDGENDMVFPITRSTFPAFYGVGCRDKSQVSASRRIDLLGHEVFVGKLRREERIYIGEMLWYIVLMADNLLNAIRRLELTTKNMLVLLR